MYTRLDKLLFELFVWNVCADDCRSLFEVFEKPFEIGGVLLEAYELAWYEFACVDWVFHEFWVEQREPFCLLSDAYGCEYIARSAVNVDESACDVRLWCFDVEVGFVPDAPAVGAIRFPSFVVAHGLPFFEAGPAYVFFASPALFLVGDEFVAHTTFDGLFFSYA